jgi:hypothetical protein
VTVLIGLLDSGIGGEATSAVADTRYFPPVDEIAPPVPPEVLRHGTDIARIIIGTFPETRLLDARIFSDRLATSAMAAATGLHWLTKAGARLVNMSFGLLDDHPALAEACIQAHGAGVILLASSPARGPAVYPASFSGVIGVCGDARCDQGMISYLGGEPADFGSCPRLWNADEGSSRGGASFAAAHASGLVARFLREFPCAGHDAVVAHLESIANFRGRERRGSGNG